MAARTYLVCTDFPRIYPSLRWKGFDYRLHYIAEDSYAVPLLWLACFRPNDLKRQKAPIDSDSPPLPTVAPVVETATAISQLQHAVSAMNSAFAANGSVETHAAYLIERFKQSGGRYLSAEWIEVYDEDPDFLKYAKRILQFFADPDSELPVLQQIEHDRQARNSWPLSQKLGFLRQQVHGRVSLTDLQAKLNQLGGDIDRLLKQLQQDGTYEPPRFQPKGASTRDMIAEVCQIRWGTRFVPSLVNGQLPESATEDEYWNHVRLIGEPIDPSDFPD